MTTRPTARSPQPSAARDGIDDGAMLAIRSVLHDQKPDVHATGAAAGRVDIHEHAKLAETTTDRPRKRGSVEQSRPKNKLIERILGHKHALKGVILVGTLLILYTRPWLIIGMIFLTICSCVGLFVALGYDRFWRRAVALGRWYAKRKPTQYWTGSPKDLLTGCICRISVKLPKLTPAMPRRWIDGCPGWMARRADVIYLLGPSRLETTADSG